jgi:hypothetical protein
MPGIDRRAFGIQAKRHITLLTLPTGCHSNRDFTRQVIIEDVLDRKRDLFFLNQLAILESIWVLRQAVD